jgi:hypothetical protein
VGVGVVFHIKRFFRDSERDLLRDKMLRFVAISKINKAGG